MMTAEELKKWAKVQAEDCLRYGVQDTNSLMKNIADHLRNAYQTGVSEEKIRRDKQEDEEGPPSMMKG
jgi:hypothetical protein